MAVTTWRLLGPTLLVAPRSSFGLFYEKGAAARVRGACGGFGARAGVSECFDVAKCAARAGADTAGQKKYAIVLTHSLERQPRARFRPEQFWSFVHWQKLNVDTVLIVPRCPDYSVSPNGTRGPPRRWTAHNSVFCADPGDHTLSERENGGIFPLDDEERDFLARHNVTVVEVPWLLPPGSPMPPKIRTGSTVGVGGCAPKDLIRLHVFNLSRAYDAVLYYDTDVTIMGDIMPVLRCASTGEFMMTEGAASPLNAGFMALKPDPRLLDASMWFAARAAFDRDPALLRDGKGGWADGGAVPSKGKFIGMECGQGFLWTLLYGNGRGVAGATSALARKTMERFVPGMPPARLVDRCTFNYQREALRGRNACPPGFTCDDLVGLHKPFKPHPGQTVTKADGCVKAPLPVVGA